MTQQDLDYAKSIANRIELDQKCQCGKDKVIRVNDKKQCLECWEKEVNGNQVSSK